jgi:hypothetical protein
VRQRALLRRKELVPLTPKAFETLLVLVQNNGQLKTKDELMKAVWPDSFLCVTGVLLGAPNYTVYGLGSEMGSCCAREGHFNV